MLTACGQGDAVWSTSAGEATWVTGDDATVVTVGGGLVSAWEATDGDERWQTELAAAWPAAVAVGDGIIAVATDRDGRATVCGLDLDTGAERWCEPVADREYSTAGGRQPAVASTGGVIAVTTPQGVVLGLDARDGSVRWEQAYAQDRAPVSRAHLAAAGDLLAVLHPESGRLLALGAASGEVRFEHSVEAFLGPYGLAIHDGLVLVQDAASIHALGGDGALQWETGELPSPGPSYQGAAADPVMVGDRLVAAPQAASTPGPDGFTLTAVARDSGDVAWVLDEPPAFTREALEATGSLLAVGDDLVVLGEDFHVVDVDDGSVARTVELGRERASGAAVVGGDVVVLDGEGRLRRVTP